MKRKIFALTPVALACKCALAQTLPTGGHIVQGQGNIGSNGNTMVVTQSSQSMIADWQSFSIGNGDTVKFVQPSSDAVALNRVIGGDPSLILGNLSANGRVYLQNPNGVLFAPGAQVSVGSLVATTLQANTAQFMADGSLQLSGAQNAGSVSNEGTINVAPGGHAVLAGPRVSNSGTIAAPGGNIALAAGGEITVDPTGAGVVTISVPVAAVGAQIVNSGTLVADGGRITLQAAAVNAAGSRVLQVDGVVRARSIEQQNGEIILSGGTSGTVAVGGQLDVSGEGAQGGQVKVLGENVLLEGTAQIDAGGTSGGNVFVGGDRQGQGSDPNALTTTVTAGAQIDVSASSNGNGGNVVVWSDNVTSYAGSITARGGASGGDGGQVEVSGKQSLQFNGEVDTSAPAGTRGNLLLDPGALLIGTTADVNGDGTTGDDLPGTTLNYNDYGPYSQSYITAAQVAKLLATTDVTLQATGNINVNSPVNVAAGGANSTLTLNSQFIGIYAPMTLNNTSLNADTQIYGSDAIRVDAPVTSLHSVALTSVNIGIAADVTAPSVTLSTPSGVGPTVITQTEGSISSNTLTVSAPSAVVSLPDTGNNTNLLDVTASQATVTVGSTPSGAPLQTGATVSGDYTLTVGGPVEQSRSMTIGGLFTVTTGGDAALDNTGNDFQGGVRFNVGGSLNLYDMNDLNAGGTADTGINITAGGVFYLGADISSTSTSDPSMIQFSSAGFNDSSNSLLHVQPGGRFIIRSSDYTQDYIGAIGFSADDPANVNYTVLTGWSGADPTTGNGYYTNRTGTIDAPNSDRPPISYEYDQQTAFDYVQTGDQAQGLLENDVPGGTGLSHYIVTTSGAFADPSAGTNKTYTVLETNDVIATVAANGSTMYGLRYDAFTRPSGPVGPDGPGNPISEITPRPVVATGVEGTNRVYDGTTNDALNIDGATLSGILPGDTVGLAAGNLVGTMADKNVGANKPVTENGALVLSGPQAIDYVLTDESTPTATITPRPVIGNGVEGINRDYDGTTTVALTISGATLSGVLPGDNVGLTAGDLVGTMADKNVGTDKPVTEHGALVLSGSDAGNYSFIDESMPIVTIFPLPVAPPPRGPRKPEPPAQTVSDPAEPFRQGIVGSRYGVPPAEVDLDVGALGLPAPARRLASADPCPPALEHVTDTRSYYFYFPYRSSTIEADRSAGEQSALLLALGAGFRIEHVRGFTSPEGLRRPRYGFQGNDELSHQRALAAITHLREVCAERGDDCVPPSVQAEAGSELDSLMESDSAGEPHEVEGQKLEEYAVEAFGSDESDTRQRTPYVQRELDEARTPAEKAQVVYPQLRRVQIDLTRDREVPVASAAECTIDHHLASSDAPAR
jgi:filamentous hemagglutinin family protein